MGTLSAGRVRGTSVPAYGDGEGDLGITSRGELLIAYGLPLKTDLVRLGDTYTCQIATGSAFTHVATMPTTRSELSLFNGEPGTGKCYVIDSIWWFCLTSITAASGATLIYQVSPSAAAPTDDAAQLINSPMGKAYGGRARRAVATTVMTANKWAALASQPAGAAVSIGVGLVAQVEGGIVIPPGATLGINVVVGTATGTALVGVSWHEAQLRIS